MARLAWDATSARYYETGIDRGVLYVGADPGVAWNGFTSLSESPSGGEARPYYIDGLKYLNLAEAEEYEATLTALSCPMAFAQCDGSKHIANGLVATGQARKPFGLSYRTKIGSDVSPDLGYKIHLVYNALAAPSSRQYSSNGNEVELVTLSWAITTLPPPITGYKRTAHMIIDTRYTDPDILAEVEDLLYGSVSGSPQLPTPDELVDLFTA